MYKSSTSSKTSIPIIDHHSSTSLHCIFRENDYYFNDSTMADKCISCNQTVTTRQQAIQCDGCLKWNHRTCNTGKLNFFFHSISSSRSFSSPCSFMKYPLCYPFWQFFLQFFYRHYSTSLPWSRTGRCRHQLVLLAMPTWFTSSRKFQDFGTVDGHTRVIWV